MSEMSLTPLPAPESKDVSVSDDDGKRGSNDIGVNLVNREWQLVAWHNHQRTEVGPDNLRRISTAVAPRPLPGLRDDTFLGPPPTAPTARPSLSAAAFRALFLPPPDDDPAAAAVRRLVDATTPAEFRRALQVHLGADRFVLAGGAVCHHLLCDDAAKDAAEDTKSKPRDYDLFWGGGAEAFRSAVRVLTQGMRLVLGASRVVDVVHPDPAVAAVLPRLQIIEMQSGIAHLLANFDVPAAMFAYDGTNILTNPLGRVALLYRCNLVDLRRRAGACYEARLLKYRERGFSILHPAGDGAYVSLLRDLAAGTVPALEYHTQASCAPWYGDTSRELQRIEPSDMGCDLVRPFDRFPPDPPGEAQVVDLYREEEAMRAEACALAAAATEEPPAEAAEAEAKQRSSAEAADQRLAWEGARRAVPAHTLREVLSWGPLPDDWRSYADLSPREVVERLAAWWPMGTYSALYTDMWLSRMVLGTTCGYGCIRKALLQNARTTLWVFQVILQLSLAGVFSRVYFVQARAAEQLLNRLWERRTGESPDPTCGDCFVDTRRPTDSRRQRWGADHGNLCLSDQDVVHLWRTEFPHLLYFTPVFLPKQLYEEGYFNAVSLLCASMVIAVKWATFKRRRSVEPWSPEELVMSLPARAAHTLQGHGLPFGAVCAVHDYLHEYPPAAAAAATAATADTHASHH